MNVEVLLLIAAILTIWSAVIFTYALATRPRELPAGAATPELGAEPPAVVNLLVTRCELTAEAADATLFDLAARRILELHQPGDDPAKVLVRVREAAPEALNAYEQRVFERVSAIAGDRLVDLGEISRRYADGGPHWFRQLRAEVIADAKQRGLIRTRLFGTWTVLVSVLAAMAVGCLGVLPFTATDGGKAADAVTIAAIPGWFCGSVFVALVLIMVTSLLLRTPGHAAAGRQVGSAWLGVGRWLSAHEALADLPAASVAVWDRYLSYGVALGVNSVASDAVDLRVRRSVRLMSGYTGVARVVVVRYPRNPFAYTQAGVRLSWSLLVLAFWAASWPLLESRLREVPPAVGWSYYVVGSAAVVRAGYKVVRSSIAKLTPVTVTGQLLVIHPFRAPTDQGPGWFQVVVDDGRRERTRPWLVRADRAAILNPGDTVQMRAQRWTRYVMAVQVVHRPDSRVLPRRLST